MSIREKPVKLIYVNFIRGRTLLRRVVDALSSEVAPQLFGRKIVVKMKLGVSFFGLED